MILLVKKEDTIRASRIMMPLLKQFIQVLGKTTTG